MRRMIDCGIWSDPRVKALSTDARLLFVYLIANPHSHVSGLYWCPTAYMAHESGLSPERVEAALTALGDLVKYDAEREVVWVVNMAAKQCASSKVWQGCASHVKTLHGSPLISEWASRYADRHSSVAAVLGDSRKGIDRVSEESEQPGIPPSPVPLSVSVSSGTRARDPEPPEEHPAVLGLCDGWARAYAAPMSPAVLKPDERRSLVAQAEAAVLSRDAMADLVERWAGTTGAKRPHPRMVIADIPELLAKMREKPKAKRYERGGDHVRERPPSECYRCTLFPPSGGACICVEPEPFPEGWQEGAA